MKPDWIAPREAALRVVAAMKPLESLRVPLREAAGFTLAADVISPVDLPRWTNSAMDGFAVRAADIHGATAEHPVELPIAGDVPAGAFPAGPLEAGTAVRVMTGAPVPDDADSVVRVEHTDGGRAIGGPDARVSIEDDFDAGRNLRSRGEDIRKGRVALRAGMVISPGVIGVAASIGEATLPVVRAPRVALLASGDELVEVEDFELVLAGRKIVSSNSYTLAAQLRAIGCEVRYLGIAGDSPEALHGALAGAEGCDALITSAGISVGEHDHIKRVLAELGATVDFWRVRMRPGSPFAFGRVEAFGGIPWFGLPGNPVSSMVTFELFARPALLRMAGRGAVYARPLEARLTEDVRTQAGLTHFVRVRLSSDEGGRWATGPTGPQGSGILTSLAHADGLLVVGEEVDHAAAGERLPVLPLDASGLQLVEAPGF